MNDKSRNKILVVLFLGVLMGALDIAIVAPALPSIQKYFGIGERILAWTFTIYVLFNLIGTPLMAKLSDKFGRRSIYILDVVLFALGSILITLSPQKSFAVLLAGRALQGFGAGGIFPVASAVIGDTFPPEKRGGALGLIGAVFGLAFLIGPVLGGVILSITTWQWLFIINLPIALVVIVMGWRLLPSKGSGTQLRFDWAGLLVLSVLLASFTYSLNQIDTQNFFSSLVSVRVLPFLLLGLALTLVFPAIERKATDPIVNMSLFHSRQIRLSSVLSAGAGLGEFGLIFHAGTCSGSLAGGYQYTNFKLHDTAGGPGHVHWFSFGRSLDGPVRFQGDGVFRYVIAGGGDDDVEHSRHLKHTLGIYPLGSSDRLRSLIVAGCAHEIHHAE